MSWSREGSAVLASVSAVQINGELTNWTQERTPCFGFEENAPIAQREKYPGEAYEQLCSYLDSKHVSEGICWLSIFEIRIIKHLKQNG